MQVKFYSVIRLIGVFLLILSYSVPQLMAQDTTKTSSVSIAKSLGIYVFPANNQKADQQSQDEFECYKWAVEQSGYDPINPTKVEAEKVDTSPDGSAVRGAARGAAAGAAIGAIAGDTGKGAAIGAAAGAIRGRRHKKMGDAYEKQAAEQNAAAQSQALEDSFKKAFRVCLEGKGYTVSE
jgi:hypothetical protein